MAKPRSITVYNLHVTRGNAGKPFVQTITAATVTEYHAQRKSLERSYDKRGWRIVNVTLGSTYPY